VNYSISFLEPQYEHLLSIIFAQAGVEGAAYVLCGRSRTDDEERLLAREVIPVREEHYLKRTDLRLSICSDSYVPVAKKARELKQSILFVHSHPEGIHEFSPQDDEEEPRLMQFFSRQAPEGSHGAVVISAPESVRARISRAGDRQTVFRVRVIGRRFQFFDAVKDGEVSIPDFFDRQVRAFGPDIQRLLSRLHIGIVGAGGTGSSVFEQLVRLGVGKVSVFDHDILDDSNVNRVYGSGSGDAGRLKVEIAYDSSQRMGLGTKVLRFPKGISFEQSAKALRDCDAIFCCTDKQAPRGILTQLSLRYFIPMFDMGAKIESEGGVIKGIFGRVTTFFPGEACLFCRGRINPETIRLEGLKPEERRALAREGYAPELETNAPAVIMFTTAVATQAVSEFLHRLTGFMGQARQTTEVLFGFHETTLGKNREKPGEQCICAQTKLWGRGDTRIFLDLTWPSETPHHPPT
jgi:molybdopterin/thiamine biosynthesis adenylyltransferase